MGYGHYVLPDGREAGYGVEATCDRDGCETAIDRGLGYLCGELPDGHRDPAEAGCGRYFCGTHEQDHDCPNPHDEQAHPYVEGEDPEEGCEAVVHTFWPGAPRPVIDIVCGVPRARHQEEDA